MMNVNYIHDLNILKIFRQLYNSFDSLFMPMGNFSAIEDSPQMYLHCKRTEE